MSDSLVQASDWYIRLHADDVTANDLQAFQQWMDSSVHNREGWERIDAVNSTFNNIDASISKAVLLKRDALSMSRRMALKKMGVMLAVSTAGAMVYKHQPWQTMLADYSTGKGGLQTLNLADETVLVLNTDTAVDAEYTQDARIIHLYMGEVLIQTGHGKGSDVPFLVKTSAGLITALGTRFSIRQHEHHVSVQVFEHAVQVAPSNAPGHSLKLQEGQQVNFSDQHISGIQSLPAGADLWSKGILSVMDMPLQEFLQELGRYHRGYLRCDPDVQATRISGSFPVNDLEAILNSISTTHQLRIDALTRYWITIRRA